MVAIPSDSFIFILIGLINIGSACHGNAALFLLLVGLFHFFYGLSKSCCDVPKPVIWFLRGVNFIFYFWGSVDVFTAYSRWQGTNRDLPGFCPSTPFLIAMIELICYWISSVLSLIRFCYDYYNEQDDLVDLPY